MYHREDSVLRFFRMPLALRLFSCHGYRCEYESPKRDDALTSDAEVSASYLPDEPVDGTLGKLMTLRALSGNREMVDDELISAGRHGDSPRSGHNFRLAACEHQQGLIEFSLLPSNRERPFANPLNGSV